MLEKVEENLDAAFLQGKSSLRSWELVSVINIMNRCLECGLRMISFPCLWLALHTFDLATLSIIVILKRKKQTP